MNTSDKMEQVLLQQPNQMIGDWMMLKAVYPNAKIGDKSNGGRMGSIRRIARSDKRFKIAVTDASIIALATD